MKQLLLLGIGFLSLSTQAQLVVQNGATLFIDAGASVTVQGDLTSNADITGSGKIIMKGTALQNLNMNGFTLPSLEIDNANHVALGGAMRVTGNLNFVNGKLQLGNHHFTLASSGNFTNAAAAKFAETNGTGEFRREVTAAGNVTLPVGSGSNYTPVEYQLSGGSYASAYVAARSVAGGHPAKHPRSTDYLNSYWALSHSGVSGATVNTVGTYADGSITGVESDIRAMTYNGTNWAMGTAQDNAANTVTAAMSSNSSQLYAMNRFVLLNSKVFLHGPFNALTAMMNDNLRANNLLPLNDPYRTATYSTAFPHQNNSVEESVNASVFSAQANEGMNIVDWIFLELRNANSPYGVLQTRSALVTKNGTVVDIDGVSPVYFKNMDAGNYEIAVRHRNHLAVNTASSLALGLSAANSNLSTLASTYNNPLITTNQQLLEISLAPNPSVYAMYSGNGNGDGVTRISGSAAVSDYSILLAGLNATLGYYRADYNMDGVARVTGSTSVSDYARFLNSITPNQSVQQHTKY